MADGGRSVITTAGTHVQSFEIFRSYNIFFFFFQTQTKYYFCNPSYRFSLTRVTR